MSTPWSTLHTAIAARLAESAYLAIIPVVLEDAGDIETVVNTALAAGGILDNGGSAAGVAIVIVTFSAQSREASRTHGHLVCDSTIRIGIHEHVTTNRGPSGFNKPGQDVLFQVIRQLQGWRQFTGSVPARVLGFQAIEDPDAAVLSWFLDVQFTQSIDLA